MAQSLKALGMGGRNGAPLMGKARTSGPCDWSHLGFKSGLVTEAEFDAATNGHKFGSGYLPHVRVSRPTYSALGLRAVVSVGNYYGWLGGDGYDCYLRRGLHEWRLETCRPTWIA